MKIPYFSLNGKCNFLTGPPPPSHNLNNRDSCREGEGEGDESRYSLCRAASSLSSWPPASYHAHQMFLSLGALSPSPGPGSEEAAAAPLTHQGPATLDSHAAMDQ